MRVVWLLCRQTGGRVALSCRVVLPCKVVSCFTYSSREGWQGGSSKGHSIYPLPPSRRSSPHPFLSPRPSRNTHAHYFGDSPKLALMLVKVPVWWCTFIYSVIVCKDEHQYMINSLWSNAFANSETFYFTTFNSVARISGAFLRSSTPLIHLGKTLINSLPRWVIAASNASTPITTLCLMKWGLSATSLRTHAPPTNPSSDPCLAWEHLPCLW